MSYSTRRSGGFAGNQQQSNLGNVGQRRPVVTNNFVPGGQLKGAGQNQQQPAQKVQQAAAQSNASVQFKNQQQTQVQQAKQQPQQQQPQQQPQQQQQQQQQSQPQQSQPQQSQPQQQEQQVQEQQELENENVNGDEMDTSGEGKKKPWLRSGNKISRREKIRRRNVRLSKILQPKNAVMIFNELTKNSNYNVEEAPLRPNGCQFRATVVHEGIEHEGYGVSKIQAKNNAAEAALRHFVRSKKMTEMNKDEDDNEKMDVTEDETAQIPLPWQHVASFAIYKLFSLWGEDPNIVRISPSNVSTTVGQRPENKPAKKMPDNPETVNPLMLVNQMLPQAKYEEIGKSGEPPNVVFSYRCSVDGQSFVGTGPNKKAAKKLAAFGVCHKVLGVQYPADVYVPNSS